MKRTICEDVYIGKKIEIPIATVEQNDDLILELRVIDGSSIVNPSEQFIELWVERPESKTIVQQITNVITNNEYVIINLKNSCVSEIGLVDFQLKLLDTNGQVQTSRFKIRVNKNIYVNDPIIAENEIEIINQHTIEIIALQNKLRNGDTISRPSSPTTGDCYFDTTLNKPIWWNGTIWVDSNGTKV